MGKREKTCALTKKDHQCKELVIDIPNNWEPIFWPECCIYKVPKNLRKLNKEVYTPQLISIGPLHHGNKQLAEMEKQKLIYLSEFFERTEVTWKDFVSILQRDEELIRHCYAEKSELCSNEYVKMILLDVVFIIEYFMRVVLENKKYEDDYMLSKPWLRNCIDEDLLLLENQVPYFVLDALFKSAFPDGYPFNINESIKIRGGFYELTCLYFSNYITQDITIPDPTKVLHFTDLLRYCRSSRRPETEESLFTESLCSATKLHEAGLKFEGIKDKCLTDIKFEKGELMCMCCKGGKLIIPRFAVDNSTERVIRNLMALEQCHYPSETYICNYIILMCLLIKTAKDVDLLVENGVIENLIGSKEEVAKLVNKLSKNIPLPRSNFSYHDICKNVENNFFSKRRHRARTAARIAMKTLQSVYFTNIWRGTSTLAAVILLVMTLLQTINSFRQLPSASMLV